MPDVADTTGTTLSFDPQGGIMLVAAVIVAAGLVGGWAASLSEDRDTPSEPTSRALVRFLLLGLIASACVPLFLSLVRSDLLVNILSPGGARSPTTEALFVFAGLCLLAAYSSRAFIGSVSQRVLQQVAQAKDTARRAESKADQAQATALEVADDEASEVVSPNPEARTTRAEPSVPTRAVDLQAAALAALARRTYRTATGVAADIGIARHRIGDILDDLHSKGLVERTTSPTTGGPRWRFTSEGKAVVEIAVDVG